MAALTGMARKLHPFMAGGAAVDTPLLSGTVTLSDLTPVPRFGLKGSGSADWLTRQGIALPAVNRVGEHETLRVLRLGREDILLTGEGDPDGLARLAKAWQDDAGPKGYWSWREEGWAWMRISGPSADAAMRRLCAIDFRPGRFSGDAIAQTRVGQIEAVTLLSQTGYDVFFDITASAFFARAVQAVAGAAAHETGLGGDET